jgi:hypothetical protein
MKLFWLHWQHLLEPLTLEPFTHLIGTEHPVVDEVSLLVYVYRLGVLNLHDVTGVNGTGVIDTQLAGAGHVLGGRERKREEAREREGERGRERAKEGGRG